MTRIGFIRHGITDWNIEKRAQGQTDILLNETGRMQARALAERLKNEDWDMIYSSDLSRAKETAEIIAQAFGLDVKTDIRLREMHCGEIEGTTSEERMNRWGEDWRSLSLGIETEESIVGRGLSFTQDIIEKHSTAKILVVSHGAILGRTLRRLIPDYDTSEHLHNTSVTKLTFLDEKWDCELYNCVQHFDNLD